MNCTRATTKALKTKFTTLIRKSPFSRSGMQGKSVPEEKEKDHQPRYFSQDIPRERVGSIINAK